MDVQDIIELFLDYKMDIKLPKNIPKYRDRFNFESYMKWAADELFMYIVQQKDRSPMVSAIDFYEIADKFSHISSEKDKIIWEAAKIVSYNIADIINAKMSYNDEGEEYKRKWEKIMLNYQEFVGGEYL